MATPTFNKYKSTTIYGNLSVRDLTNSSGSSVVEVASIDLSGNFLSRGDSTFTKAVVCNASVGDINANNKLATKEYVDNAVSGGGGSSILGLNNAWSGTNSYNSYFPTSTLGTSTSITNDSIVNKGMLDTIYQTISGMSSYLTTSAASSLYQTISGMSSYLTTATASSTYQTIAGMSSYLTTATASSTYQTIAGMSSYLTTATAASTYQTIAGLSGYATLAGTQTFTGDNTFRNSLIKTSLPKGNYIQLDPYFIKVDDDNIVTNNQNIYIEPEGLTLTNSVITQSGSIQNTLTNTMVNLQMTTGSYGYVFFQGNTDYSSLKMPNYFFCNRNSGSFITLTLSTDAYIDDGQYLLVRKLPHQVPPNYTLNVNAGSGTTILSNFTSVTTIQFSSLNTTYLATFLYNKPALRWVLMDYV